MRDELGFPAHFLCGKSQWFSDSSVTRFTPVNDTGFRQVDLFDVVVELLHLVEQSTHLLVRESLQVLLEVVVARFSQIGRLLADIYLLGDQLPLLALQTCVYVLQLREGYFLLVDLAGSGIPMDFDRNRLRLYLVDLFPDRLFAALRVSSVFFILQGCHPGAHILEWRRNVRELGIYVGDLRVDFRKPRRRLISRGFGLVIKLAVVV